MDREQDREFLLDNALTLITYIFKRPIHCVYADRSNGYEVFSSASLLQYLLENEEYNFLDLSIYGIQNKISSDDFRTTLKNLYETNKNIPYRLFHLQSVLKSKFEFTYLYFNDFFHPFDPRMDSYNCPKISPQVDNYKTQHYNPMVLIDKESDNNMVQALDKLDMKDIHVGGLVRYTSTDGTMKVLCKTADNYNDDKGLSMTKTFSDQVNEELVSLQFRNRVKKNQSESGILGNYTMSISTNDNKKTEALSNNGFEFNDNDDIEKSNIEQTGNDDNDDIIVNNNLERSIAEQTIAEEKINNTKSMQDLNINKVC